MLSCRTLLIALALNLSLMLTTKPVVAQDFETHNSHEPSVYSRGAVARLPADSRIAMGSGDKVSANRESEPSTNFPRLMVESSPSGEPVAASRSKNQLAAPLVTVTSSLAVVLGLFAALVWVSRKYGSKSLGGRSIPSEVLQNLGSTAIDPRTRISMIRLGGRILVVAQTSTGIQPISEITDPEEVTRLTAICVGDSKSQFSSALQSIESEPGGAGFLGKPTAAPKPRPRGSLFTTA